MPPSQGKAQGHTRRSLVAATATLIAAPTAFAAASSTLVYVGTQGAEPGQGVVAARLDARTGKLTALGLAAELQRPTWVLAHPTKAALYAVSETGNDGKSQGSVHALRADPASGRLSLLGTVPSGGGGPTHLAFDARSKSILVANYGTGQVAALPVQPDASLSPPVSIQADQGSGPNPRQKGPHAHGVALSPSGRHALVADLGADRIFVYGFDPTTRMLAPAATPSEATPPGVGPRHLTFHPNGRRLYVLSELVPELRVYGWDEAQGRLSLLQTLTTGGDPAKAAVARGAEVAVSKDGRFVYVSVRGEDVLVAYAVDRQSGHLTEVQRLPAGGQAPWSFAIDPSGRWMLVANQASNAVVVFARDKSSGRLSATDETLAVTKPTSVAYLGA